MQLIIAEKPSVGRDLARVLGVRGVGRNAIEGRDSVITWCIGHLVELEEPHAYDPRWKSWRMDTLPMIPGAFKLRAVAGTRDQLAVVQRLLRDRRFTEVVNACDAGREGELIFRYVYELAGSHLRVRRLWISSLTDEAIRQGFAALRPGTEYDALGDAARCRSEADWLVGMNATRGVTIRFREAGGTGGQGQPSSGPQRSPTGDGVRRGTSADRTGRRGAWGGRGGRPGATGTLPAVYSIGRVQTPTLAILVRREQAIRSFQPRDYWEVKGHFTATTDGGPETFSALWTAKREGGKVAVSRFGEQDIAKQVAARTNARGTVPDGAGPVVESLVQKKSREPPPLLFDLTSLQRTANRRWGLSAARTLEAAQALYERHKLLTYPRTDSRHLPKDMVDELPKLFRGLAAVPDYAAFAQPLAGIDLARVAGARRIFDGAKVHDHHAIIPTGKVLAADGLSQDERRIFDLVARRFLGAFHPDAEFALTEAVVRVGVVENTTTRSRGGGADHAGTHGGDVDGGGQKGDGDSEGEGRAGPPPGDLLITDLPAPPDRFVARGRIRTVAGWQTVAGFDEKVGAAAGDSRSAPHREGRTGPADSKADRGANKGDDEAATLPVLFEGQPLHARVEVVSRQTRPPARHSEATLLGAMESAGREIEDEALRAAMKDTGLGTPATRAATIETLMKRGFIVREGKQLAPTPMGISLIDGLPTPSLASPELTGAWEARLARMARGQETRATFMTDIARYVREVTDALRQRPGADEAEGGHHGGDGGGQRGRAPATTAITPGPAAGLALAPTRPGPRRATTAIRAPDGRGTSAPRIEHGTASGSSEGARSQDGPPASAGADPAVAVAALACPRCRVGQVVTGNRGWGCSRWRDGCPFVIWFHTAGKRLTAAQLRALVQHGKTRKGTWAPIGSAGVPGRLVLDLTATRDAGAARFSAA